MDDSPQSLLKNLIKLSKIDSGLTSILYERRKNENDLKSQKSELKSAAELLAARERALNERKEQYRKEEKSIKEENEKLTSRRKALTTFSNYKLQQAAEKEIENAAKQLGQREEELIGTLDTVDALQKQADEAKVAFEAKQTGYDKFVAEAAELFSSLEDREGRRLKEKEEILPAIPKKEYTLYEKIREKYPEGPVAAVREKSCSGCFMQVGPQVMVQMSRGDSLTRCPGCGRIVYLEESKEE